MHKRFFKGFTLAEILITMSVIGIIAIMAVPPFINEINTRVWNARSVDTLGKLSEATNRMKVDDMLSGYANTDAFVNELSKNMKILKRCDAMHLENCFTKGIKIDGEVDPILTKDLQTSKSIFKTNEDTNNPTVGIVTTDGIPMILSFDQNCERLNPFSSTPRDTNGTSTTLTCLHILYDTNGLQGPNKLGKDVRGHQIAFVDKSCLIDSGDACFDSTIIVPMAMSRAECNEKKLTLGIDNCEYEDDYWAGAVQVCGGVSHMPSEAQLASLANYLYDTNMAKENSKSYPSFDIPDKPLNQEEAAKLGLFSPLDLAIWAGETSSNTAKLRAFRETSSFRNNHRRSDGRLRALCIR